MLICKNIKYRIPTHFKTHTKINKHKQKENSTYSWNFISHRGGGNISTIFCLTVSGFMYVFPWIPKNFIKDYIFFQANHYF